MAGKMPASNPTQFSGTSSEVKAADKESLEISAEVSIDASNISDKLATVSLRGSNQAHEPSVIVEDSPKAEKQPVGMTAAFSNNNADLISGGRMEGQCAFYFASGHEPIGDWMYGYGSARWDWSTIVNYLDFTYGVDRVPDLSHAKPPTDYYVWGDIERGDGWEYIPNREWRDFVPAPRHIEAKLHGPVRWESPKLVPGKPFGSVGVVMDSIPWSEVDVARLWCLASRKVEYLEKSMYNRQFRLSQFDSDYERPMRCRRCQGDLQDKNLKRRSELQSVGVGINRNKLVPYNPPSREGVVGEFRNAILDNWTGMQIGTECWDHASIESNFRQKQFRYWRKITKYGCWGHPGKLVGIYRKWTCCGRFIASPGCTNYSKHELQEDREIIKDDWYLFDSPNTRPKSFRNAIALSCAIGKTVWGDKELIRVTAIDYYSGELLIDNLVWPDIEILDTNAHRTGISWERLRKANQEGKAIRGRDAARNTLFEYLGDKTILILHDGPEQLVSLRIIHRNILDVKWLVPPTEEGAPRESFGLEVMAQDYFHRNIKRDSKVVTTLENALACRDLTRHFAERYPLPEVWIPEFVNLSEVTKNEDLCKLWNDSEQVVKAMTTGPDYDGACKVNHSDSGTVTGLRRWRVHAPPSFKRVLRDLSDREVDEDCQPI